MNKLNTLIIIMFLIVGFISFKTYSSMKVLKIRLIEENQQLKFKLNMKAAKVIDPLEDMAINNETYSKYYVREN